jgi:hypothetical protein
MNESDRRAAAMRADKFCSKCQGSGVVVEYLDFGIEQAPIVSYDEVCKCVVKYGKFERHNWSEDCGLCWGEGLIRGLDWGDGPGGMEYAWEVCDCDVNPPSKILKTVEPFEF